MGFKINIDTAFMMKRYCAELTEDEILQKTRSLD